MRGSPPLQIVLCLIAFAVFAIPLARLTFARPQAVVQHAEPAVVEKSDATNSTIRVRLAHVPSSLSLKLGDTELLPTGTALNSTVEFQAPLIVPKDGIELFLQATWPDNTPDTAVTVELEPDGLETQSQTRWSSGTNLDEVLPYQWKS